MPAKFLYLIIAILIVIGALVAWQQFSPEPGKISNFAECEEAGHPIMESYPRRCAVKGGDTFTEDIGDALEKQNLIRITSPQPNQIITSPLLVRGEARGNWYFEASFPVALYDGYGKLLVQVPAQAQGEWMTTEFVPFEARLEFTPATGSGFLVLEKDNPSGLPEHADQLRIPIRFSR